MCVGSETDISMFDIYKHLECRDEIMRVFEQKCADVCTKGTCSRDDLYYICKLGLPLSAQKTGPAYEKVIRSVAGWDKSEAVGDAVMSNKYVVEIKTSTITKHNPVVNIVQFRPKQRIDVLCLFVVDASVLPHMSLNMWLVPFTKFYHLCSHKMCSAHGAYDMGKKEPELRLSLSFNKDYDIFDNLRTYKVL